MTETIELKHNATAAEWQLGTERVPVFSVEKTVPNPEFGKPLPEQPDPVEGAVFEPRLDDRETITQTTTYDMPAKPNAGLALAYLKKARQNEDTAASWLLELAIGSEGYDALTDELSREDDPEVALATMRNVIKFVATRALGGLGKA